MTLTSEENLIVAPGNAQVSALIEATLQMRDRIGSRGLFSGAAGSRRNLLDDILEPGGSLGYGGSLRPPPDDRRYLTPLGVLCAGRESRPLQT